MVTTDPVWASADDVEVERQKLLQAASPGAVGTALDNSVAIADLEGHKSLTFGQMLNTVDSNVPPEQQQDFSRHTSPGPSGKQQEHTCVSILF
jgi:hypothetical protein